MHASATRFRAPRALEPPARASSRRRRVVVARRARNFNNPADPARSAVVAPALGATDAESEPAAEPSSRAAPAAVVAGVAAAALLAHASPALGADTAFEASARAAGVEGPLGESIVAASPQSLFYASPRAPRPTVDAGAHERYVVDEEMREKLRRANPQAFRNVLRRMLEAAGRGMWNADDDVLERLRTLYAETEDELEGVRTRP